MGLSLMSKRNKAPYEKLYLFIYIFQILLFIIGIVGSALSLFLIGYSFYYGIKEYYSICFISFLISISFIVNYFTFGKFKEVRKYYKNLRGNKKVK